MTRERRNEYGEETEGSYQLIFIRIYCIALASSIAGWVGHGRYSSFGEFDHDFERTINSFGQEHSNNILTRPCEVWSRSCQDLNTSSCKNTIYEAVVKILYVSCEVHLV